MTLARKALDLVDAHWPHGWHCARCAGTRSCMTRSIVGTVMEHTRLPLTVWFLAITC